MDITLTEFAGKLNPLITLELRQIYPNISNVVDTYNGIHKGCSCTRKNRIANTQALFNDLLNKMTPDEKTWLTSILEKSIIAKDDQTEVWRIE